MAIGLIMKEKTMILEEDGGYILVSILHLTDALSFHRLSSRNYRMSFPLGEWKQNTR